MADNFVSITGNVTRDPELKHVGNGSAVTEFSLAVNRRWQNRTTQEWEESVGFFDVTVWGDMAENVAESVRRGARVVVTGRLDYRTWEQDGAKRSAVQIVADEVAPSLRYATVVIQKIDKRGPAAAQAEDIVRGAFAGIPEDAEQPF